MRNTDKLKPCPFCGGEARLEHIHGATWDRFVVTCKSKKCCAFYIGYCDEGIYDTRTKAIEAWNTRKPMENIIQKIERIGNIQFSSFGTLLIAVKDVIDILKGEEYNDKRR